MCNDGCMYVCMYALYRIYLIQMGETQAWPSSVGQLSSLILPELPLIWHHFDQPY